MNNWEKKTFGTLYEIPSRNGLSKPSKVRGTGYKMINMGELFSNDRIYDIPMELVPLSDTEKERAKIEEGDLLFARQSLVAAGAGKCSIVLETSDMTVFESHLIRVRLDRKVADPMFYYYYFKSSISPMQSIIQHCVQAGIKGSDLEKLEVCVPPIAIQAKISSFLSLLDEKIKTNCDINDNLLQQAQTIFTQEFLSIDGVPEGWQKSSLLGIADYLNGLAMQKYRPKDGEQGLPVLKIKELRQGSCDASSELCSPSIKPEYIVHDGDVIFSWSGSLLVDLWCGGTCGLNQHLFKVTSTKYDKWFYYAWTNHHLQKFVAIAADMATTMGHIKREELEKAEVLIPSQSDYDRIGSLLAPIYDLIIANRIENRKLASLRDELLPQLMSGQLDVSEVSL